MRPEEMIKAAADIGPQCPRPQSPQDVLRERARIMRDESHRFEKLADALGYLSDENANTLRDVVNTALHRTFIR